MNDHEHNEGAPHAEVEAPAQNGTPKNPSCLVETAELREDVADIVSQEVPITVQDDVRGFLVAEGLADMKLLRHTQVKMWLDNPHYIALSGAAKTGFAALVAATSADKVTAGPQALTKNKALLAGVANLHIPDVDTITAAHKLFKAQMLHKLRVEDFCKAGEHPGFVGIHRMINALVLIEAITPTVRQPILVAACALPSLEADQAKALVNAALAPMEHTAHTTQV